MRQEAKEYRCGPRSVLRAGDRFRASAGPYYVTQDGREIVMAEHGIFVFCRYVIDGRQRWIEATRPDEFTTYRFPLTRRKATIEGYVLRPYKVRAVRKKVRA